MTNHIVDHTVPGVQSRKGARPRMLRCKAVAEMLDLPEQRVYILAREGVLPHVKVGRAIRFNEAELEEWIAAGGSSYPRSDQ